MTTTDALKYLPQMGLDPLKVVGCAAAKCPNSFALANGFAVEATVGERNSISRELSFCSTTPSYGNAPAQARMRTSDRLATRIEAVELRNPLIAAAAEYLIEADGVRRALAAGGNVRCDPLRTSGAR